MKPDSTPSLTISAAVAVVPPSAQSVASWLDAVDAELARTQLSEYGGLTQLLFAQLGTDPAQLSDRGRVHALVPQAAAFRCAGEASQTDLAYRALERLGEDLGAQALRRCGLLMVAHSSLNENFYQSTAAYLASKFGLSNAAHFSVGQMDGAAFFQALDIANAFFHSDDKLESALLVAAEKWPLPYPRVLPCSAVLGDGAAALAFHRTPQAGSLRLCGSLVQCSDGFGDAWSTASAGCSAFNASHGTPIAPAAVQAIRTLLDQQDTEPHDIALWVPAGPTPAIEAEVAALLHIAPHRLLAEEDADTGYLSTAAAPRHIARVLERVRSGDLAPDASILVWGAGLGGSVGAALFRVVQAGEAS